MNPEEFRKHGHAVIDFLADYHANLASKPVMPELQAGAVRSAIPKNPPMQPEGFSAVLSDVESVILPNLTLWQHPSFFGFFPSNAELSSVLGDLLSSGLGVLGLSWQASPAITELEEVVTGWLRQMLGLPDGFSGVIQDTASTSTLVALISARERTSKYGAAGGGLQAETSPLVVYTSGYSHSSVEKAAVLAGFGANNVRAVATDAAFAMLPEALEQMVAEDLKAGKRPCAVVATSGTTTSTAFDPIEKLANIAQKYNMWLHIDAAMAGNAMILPECRHLWKGAEQADSIVINPHKWLGAVFDNSYYYVRDPQHLIRVMSTNPSYLQNSADGDAVKNLRDWGIPLGRRFRALKLWALIRQEGVEGLQQRLRRDLKNAKWLEAQVKNAEDWEVLAPVELQTLCLRYKPVNISSTDLDKLTKHWCQSINNSGKAYLTAAVLDGSWVVRVSIGALGTEQTHLEALWSEMQAQAKASYALISHE